MLIELAFIVLVSAAAFFTGKRHGIEVEQEAIAKIVSLKADEKTIVATIKARVSDYLAKVEAAVVADVKADLKKL